VAEGFITMKATDLLTKQHKEVKGLFKKIEETEDSRQRRKMLEEVARSLEGHTVIEEEIFYPAVRGLETRKAEEMVLEAYEEHHVVKLVLAELPRVNPEDERFEAKMTVLSELVEHHAEEEEKEMFKLAQKLGKGELEALGEQMEKRFEAFRRRASEAA
jgi:Hemerythrin HHE cation binding domain